jgi:muramidase (phage lysozyme)
MANTEINPFAYDTAPSNEPAIDPSIAQYLSSMGEPSAEIGPISEENASAELPVEANALLKTISGTESPDYHTIYGGQKVKDLRKHPGVPITIKEGPNAGKTSTAAGKYQFLKGTWEAQAAKLGLTDFSPKSQDLAAWDLAKETYAKAGKRDLLADLKSKDANVHRYIAKTLAPIWTSLPGGIEQGQDADQYISAYNKNLGGDNQISTIETYDIPLSDGSILHAPKTATREEALAYAKANGITAVGLQDIPLASGAILHAPENLSVEDAIAQAQQMSPDMDFTLAESEEPGRFEAALRRSGEGFKQTLQGIGLGTSAALDGEDTQAKMDALKAAQAKEGPGPKSMSVQDIQDIYNKEGAWAAAKELPGFAGEKILESSASTAAPLAVGMAAGAVFPPVGIAAGIATAVVQQFGDFIGRQAQENMDAGELDPGIAIVGAIPAGVLDFVTDKFTFGLGMGAKQAAKAAAVDEIKKSVISKVGTHALKGAVLEPVTEVGQQVLERAQARLPVTGEEAGREYKEAAGTALAAGTVQGAVGGVNQAVQERTQEPDEGLLNNGQPIMAPEQPITPEGVPVQEAPVSAEIAPNEALATEEEEVPLPGVLAAKTRAAREELDALRAAQTDTGEAVQQGAVQEEDVQEEPKVRGQWVKDVFGVKESSGIFKKLKDLDIDNPADHPAIDAQLDTLKTIKAPQYEAITQRMDAAKATQPEIQPQVQPEIQPQVQPQVQQPEGVQPSANQIPEATTPDVSSSAQPKILQEGQGAPISSEGVREGRPETGQAKEEKVEPFRYSVAQEKEGSPSKTIKQLEVENKSTYPKIPVKNVFSSDTGALPLTIIEESDKAFSEKPESIVTQKINVADIVPTQKNININNLKTVKGKGGLPELTEYKGKYYINDGHHRIANDILNGKQTVEAKIFNSTQPYSVAPTPEGTGHTSASLYETLSPEMKRLVDSGKAVIHDTAETLPAGEHPENVQGLTTAEGVTHYVANKLTPETIQKVALHEVGVHAGMEKMVGTKTWDNVKSQAMTNKGEAFDRARAAAPKNTPEHLKAEETLAYLVENSPELPIVKRIISSVRNFARTKLGMKVQLTEADARHLAVSALRRESKTAERTARKETAYAEKQQPSESNKDLGKKLADSGLVKTSDKSIVDSVKEGFNNFKGSSISKEYSKIQTSFVDSSAGLRRALSDLDTFDMNGKLRADMLHSKFDQIYNIIRESFNSGPVVLSSDGGVMASENKQLALRDIFKRIDSLKFDEPRGTFFTVMRISAGEENLRKDIVNRGIANDAIEAANNLDEFAKDVSDKVKYGQLKAQSAALRKEAKKILDRVGIAPEVDGKRLGTEKLVTKEHIDQARSLLDKNPEMAPIMADIYSLLRASVDLWEKTGLVNNEVANEWRSNPSYIPLYKSMDDLYDDPNEYIKVLKSGPKSIKEVKRLEGGTHAVNVGENLVKHITFMTGAAAQNQLRKAAVSNLSMVDDTVKRTHPDDKQAVMFKVDGKKVYYHIDDPMVLEALETAMPSLAAWTKYAQPYAKVFRTVTLVNPLYWYRQTVRDPLHANLVSQTGIVHPGQAVVAFAQILAGEAGLKSKTFKNYEALKRQGVVGAVDALTDPKQFIKAAASKPGGVKKFGAWVMRIHEASDAATRVIVYEAGLKEAKQRGLSGQKAQNFATMRAREIINFAKKGNSEAIANIRATVPFFSSALNSMDTIARAATGMGLNKKEAARARKMFATRSLVLASVSAAWALHLQDDEDYIKSPDWVNSWLIPTGIKDSPFWRLPIMFEAGFFFKVLPELMVRLVSGTITPKAAREETSGAAMQLLVPPIPIPQILKPALEVITNYDSFTKRPIESVADLSKTKEQRDSKASDLAKFVSKATPLSPNQIEHLGKGYFTELWAVTALLAENFLHEGPAKPEKYLGEIPIIKGVLTKPEQDKTVNQFYEIEKAAAEISNTIKGARKTGEKKVYEEMMADPEKAKLFRAYPSLNNTSDRISKLRKNIERIKNDPATTPAEKTKRIRGVQQQINKAAEQGMATAKRLKLDI